MDKYQFIVGDATELPPQARAIWEFLMLMSIGCDDNVLSESQIEQLIQGLSVPGLETRQAPFRLWKYHRLRLIKAGRIKLWQS